MTPTPGSPRRRGLGRGLDALLTGSLPAEQSADGVLIEIQPGAVESNPEQPRTRFDGAELATLAESLRLHGMLQPIVVEASSGGYRLVAGERRLRAARLAELASVPALVRPASESARHALELALTENLLRSNLSPMEEATAFTRLADAFGLSHEAIALRVGRSRSVVTNTIRLLALPASIQSAVVDGRISVGHARSLLGLGSAADQEALAQRIEREGLTVRDAERLIQRQRASDQRPAVTRRPRWSPARSDDQALVRGLEAVMGTAVHCERRGSGGRLVINFASDEDLHALYTRLDGPPL